MAEAPKYLGNFAACEPWAAVGMTCDDCNVSWTGCWDNFECPKCGKGELPSAARTVTCPDCGGEGRELRGNPNDPHPKDYGPCLVCKGERVVEIEVEPIEMEDLDR